MGDIGSIPCVSVLQNGWVTLGTFHVLVFYKMCFQLITKLPSDSSCVNIMQDVVEVLFIMTFYCGLSINWREIEKRGENCVENDNTI